MLEKYYMLIMFHEAYQRLDEKNRIIHIKFFVIFVDMSTWHFCHQAHSFCFTAVQVWW